MSYLASSVARRVKNITVGMISRRVSSTKAAANSGVDATRRIGSAGDLALYKEFEEWMIRFEKSYDSEDEKQRRFKLFKHAVKRIKYQNLRHGLGFRLNRFSDLTSEEIGRRYSWIPRADDVSPYWKKRLAPWLYEELYGIEALLKRYAGSEE